MTESLPIRTIFAMGRWCGKTMATSARNALTRSEMQQIIDGLSELFWQLDRAHQDFALALVRMDVNGQSEGIDRLAAIRAQHAALVAKAR